MQMTREIKFRAWDKVADNMYYFDLYDLETSIPFIHRNKVPGARTITLWHPQYIMQFTWLKDKNWVDIYEWDVVARNHMWIWRMTKHIVKRESVDTWWWYISVEYVWYQDVSFWEVIWNIYENKDLLSIW